MRSTIPKVKAEGAMLTSEVSMMLTKRVNIISKVGVAHVMEERVLQTVVAVMVDNTVLTREWSSLEVTSVTISAPI
jgi:hypothetical protein